MIFFDLDGTLLNHDEAERQGALHLAKTLSLVGHEDEFFVRRWRDASQRSMAMYLSGSISFEQQRRYRLEDVLGCSLSSSRATEIFKVYLQGYESNWRLYDDVIPCLERLGHTSSLGLITNGNDKQQRKKLVATKIASRFTVIVTSEAVGVSKPDRRIFDVACSRFGQQNQDCTYVGDHPKSDAAAACSAGLHGIWLDRTPQATVAPLGVERIASLNELKP